MYGARGPVDCSVNGQGHGAWSSWVERALCALDEASLKRKRMPIEAIDSLRVRFEGVPLTLFSANDYLGLSCHPEVRAAAAESASAFGMGPRGSALICGYTDQHEALEQELARLKGTEAALLTPSGFSANMALFSAFGGADVAIFSDSLNHASIVDACRLAARSGAEVSVYPHADVSALDALLERCDRPRRLIVSDGLFSMDGDAAPLEALVELKKRHGALLCVDDAHGTLVFGASGGGVAEAQGVSADVDLHVGTLSKAFGALGGFVAASKVWCEWLLNKGRAQIYSTSLPLPLVAAARAALSVAQREPAHRERLWAHIERVAEALHMPARGPVFSRILGDPERALEASRHLLAAGIHVTAIRPPTVPTGTSRLRVTLSAAHRSEDIDALLDAMKELEEPG